VKLDSWLDLNRVKAHTVKFLLGSADTHFVNAEDPQKEDASVWSSYADLFTNVAVIFLVMFVFALLKAGLNQLQAIQIGKKHEAELNARLSPEEIQRSEERIGKIESSITEMKRVESLVDEKMKEIQTFAKTLQQNKGVLNEVIEDQKKKDSLLHAAGERMKKKDQRIQQLEARSSELAHGLELLSQEREKLLKASQAASRANEQEQLRLKRLEEEMSQKSSLQAALNSKVEQLTVAMQKDRATIEGLEKQNQSLNARIQASQLAEENLKMTRELMQSELKSALHAKEKLEKAFGELKGKVQRESSTQQELQQELARLNGELEKKVGELEHFKSLYSKAIGQADSMQNRLSQTQDQMKTLAASMQEMKNRLRSGVAESLRQKFLAQKMKVDVDPATGTITLLIGNHLLFKKNSYQLSQAAQKALNRIAPIYADVIFGDPYIASKIEGIEVTGHASPTYRKSYADPITDLPEAYSHNMRLSAQRAASITNYLVGRSIGAYRHKDRMKLHLSAIGRSYMAPIESKSQDLAKRTLASVEGNGCGKFDCDLSQRVEIGFRLKDDMKALEKLIDSMGSRK
jgi:outer membrane protein OmpA-like peptidoglycan-associated protein